MRSDSESFQRFGAREASLQLGKSAVEATGMVRHSRREYAKSDGKDLKPKILIGKTTMRIQRRIGRKIAIYETIG